MLQMQADRTPCKGLPVTVVRNLQGQDEFAVGQAVCHLEIVVDGSAVQDIRTFQDRRHELFDHRCMVKIAEAVTQLPLSSIDLHFQQSEGFETPFEIYELDQTFKRFGGHRPPRLRDARLVTPQGDPSVDMKFLIIALLNRCRSDGLRYIDVESLYNLTLYAETLRRHRSILGLHVGGELKAPV
ncbi:hypothetical protein F52700_7598 [Fusarium sp. NRRL 52700]|nr:hypothetical protein F52700_7598 [Fusarium sp. NRRL 52700]